MHVRSAPLSAAGVSRIVRCAHSKLQVSVRAAPFFCKTAGSGFARGIAACYITVNQGTTMNLFFANNSSFRTAGQVRDGRVA
jgi:hypothetical protein